MLRQKIPAIITDIDGVLVRGNRCLNNVTKALKYIRQPLNILYPQLFPNEFRTQVPFICLSNGGGKIVEKKAKKLNKLLEIDDDEVVKIKNQNLILNFTPLTNLIGPYMNEITLICGVGDIENIAIDCGISRYITFQSFSTQKENTMLILSQRWNYSLETVEKLLKDIKCVCILDDIIDWEIHISIFIDIAEKYFKAGYAEPFSLPIFIVHDDLIYPDNFELPRICLGVFTEIFKNFYLKKFNVNANINFSGKPSPNAFLFASN